MTSVQSLLPRSNGNKWVVILFFIAGSMIFSCSSPKEIPRSRRDTTTVSKRNKRSPETRVDTVKWTEVSKDKYPPIVYDGGPKIRKENIYNAALLIPFNASDYNSGEYSDEDERFIQFYAGFKLGLRALDSEGIRLNVEVFDTESSSSTLRSKLRRLNNNTHVIIGPYDRELLRLASDFAEDRQIPLVSPWQSSSRITQDNPYYIQLRPDLRDHYDKMVDEVLKHYRPEQVVVLKNGNGDDESRVQYVQEYAASLLRTSKDPFREFSVNEDSLIQSEFYMSDLFDEKNATVFIIQNYSFDDDDFVYNCLRKLSAAKGLRETTVYGLPLLLDTDKIDFNLYKLLNVKVVRSRFVDNTKPEVQAFRTSFLNEFSVLPNEEAYYGFDVITYFGRALSKYGTEFQYYLDQDKQDLLETYFDIQKTFSQDGRVSDDFRDINYFVNKHLDIVEFKGNRFQVAPRR